jgi:uncharacterized protein (TIGR03118 family)
LAEPFILSQVHLSHEIGSLGRGASILVSDGSVTASLTDKDLGNPWGLAASPNSFWWVNDNHTGLSTLYSGAGAKQPLRVAVPPPAGSPAGTTSSPTGMVFNRNTDFVVSQGGTSGASAFIFATEDGTISGWNPRVDTNNAVLAGDNSGSGAIYKGLALANNGGSDFLYATNFGGGPGSSNRGRKAVQGEEIGHRIDPLEVLEWLGFTPAIQRS